MPEPDVVRAITEMGGVASRKQLLTVCSARQLDHAVAAGTVRRIAFGRYATHELDEAVLAARAHAGVLSGLSAAQYWGWGVKWAPKRPEITVPRNRSRTAKHAQLGEGVDVRRRDLPQGAVVDGIVTSRTQTVLDCARTLPLDEALSVADSALRDPRVTRDELINAVAKLPRTGRAAIRRVVDLASGEAANPFESCVRAASLEVSGLHLVPQVQVDNVGWADLVDTRLRIVVECDSWAYHSGEDLFRQDVRRYTDMVRRDWLVVRFVWEDAMVRADRVHEVLVDVVRLREGQRASQAAYASKV